MARSPSDATRFTATGPYAASSSSFSPNPTASANPPRSSQISFGAPAPSNETAQQKIARLRAAAALARGEHESQFDKIVRIGRRWADRAHRFTALGLIGLTVVSGMVAVGGITDMLMHNRKRRNEWFAEQQAKTARDVMEARTALEQGMATEDQILLINRERAAWEAAEAKKNRPGIFKRTTGWLFGGLASEEQKGGRLGAGARDATTSQPAAEELLGDKEPKGVLQAVQDKVEGTRRSGERVQEVVRPEGGPLDRRAQSVSDAVVDNTRSWTSWISGR